MSRLTIVSLVIAGVLALRIGSLALSDFLDDRRPHLALLFNGSNEGAQLQIASQALRKSEPALNEARSAAVEALEANPLSWRSLQMLAAIAEKEGQIDNAWPLIMQSSLISIRNDTNQAWELFGAYQAQDWSRLVALIDRVYAVEKRFRAIVVKGVASLLSYEGFIDELSAALGRNPEWRPQLLNELNQIAGDSPGMAQLYLALTKTPSPPSPREIGRVLSGLIAQGAVQQAYDLWRASLPSERGDDNAFLDNADFRFGLSILPFDWTTSSSGRSATRIIRTDQGRVLQIEFFGGRQEPVLIRRMLALPPGTYSFSGAEEARGLVTPRGIAWRASCVGSNAQLGQTPPLQSDAQWRTFDVTLEVGAECSFQVLELAILARTTSERDAAGIVSFTNLSIAETGR